MSNPDDDRLGQVLRTIRRRERMTQEQLASHSGVPIKDVRRIEGGHAGTVQLDRIRGVLQPLDARLRVVPWWRGAAIDRLIDEDHAALVEVAAGLFVRRGWRQLTEVTFADFGERGSIDLLGGHEMTLTVAVCEIKSAIGSLEETNRKLDTKVRLAPKIAERAFGWRPRNVGRLLIVPDDTTIRRIVARHSATMEAIYPARGRAVRAWLRMPSGPLAAIWFLSNRPPVAPSSR